MTEPLCTAILWPVVALQVLGLFSAVTARLAEGSRGQAACQHLFLACLAMLGAATLTALGLGMGCWLSCGVVLSLMVLAATWDVRGCPETGAGTLHLVEHRPRIHNSQEPVSVSGQPLSRSPSSEAWGW